MADLNTYNVGTNYVGILNLGGTINQPISNTLQSITDGRGGNSSISISATSMAVNSQLFIGNDGPLGWEPAIYSDNSSNVNISVNTDTIVVSNNYSTGSYSTGPSSAIFEMASTTQGMLLPRMTRLQREAILRPEEGLVVYDTTLHKICYFSADTIPGWYSFTPTPA
jgi:hypothetical protein